MMRRNCEQFRAALMLLLAFTVCSTVGVYVGDLATVTVAQPTQV